MKKGQARGNTNSSNRNKEINGMLLYFKVKNYTCFAEEATLSFEAFDEIEDTEDVLYEPTKGVKILPKLAVLGANGAGKSKLLDALNTLIELICYPTGNIQGLPLRDVLPSIPFRFCAKKIKEPTRYEIAFFVDKKYYKYVLSIGKDKDANFQIKSESLHEISSKSDDKGNREEGAMIFNRTTKTVKLGDFEEKENFSALFEFFINNAPGSSSILGTCVTFRYGFATRIVDWFKKCSFLNDSDFYIDVSDLDNAENYNWFKEVAENDYYKSELCKIINILDPMIKEVEFVPEDDAVKGKKRYNIRTIHKFEDLDGKFSDEPFPLNWESAGTQKLIGYLAKVLPILTTGGLLIVDELDSKFHPLLHAYILKLFVDDKNKKNRPQILFSTHNGALLNELSRVDEVYFVNKDEKGKSKLYSLVDFYMKNPKLKDEEYNWYKDYLKGMYYAVPENLL